MALSLSLKSFEPILLPLPAHIRKPAVMYELMKDTFEDCSPGCPELPVMTLWSNRINLFAIRTSIPLEPNSTADPIKKSTHIPMPPNSTSSAYPASLNSGPWILLPKLYKYVDIYCKIDYQI